VSINARIHDALELQKIERNEGALTLVLAAISATSRKRYPKNAGHTDKEAFTKFLGQDLYTAFPGRCGDGLKIRFRGEALSLQDMLYKFVRCELAHEAELPVDVYFYPDDKIGFQIRDTKVGFSEELINALMYVVVKAPENEGLFSGIAITPPQNK